MPNATVRSLDLQQDLRQQHLRLTCCALFLMALLTLWPGRAAHAAQPWREALPAQIQTVGSGTMTWLGFRIYQATLWAAQKPLDESQPFALLGKFWKEQDKQPVSSKHSQLNKRPVCPYVY